ncbi:hypothetical protein DSECCO2_567340 [anaerobic digester metagenome]
MKIALMTNYFCMKTIAILEYTMFLRKFCKSNCIKSIQLPVEKQHSYNTLLVNALKLCDCIFEQSR